jgi:Serine carboxypeptidase
MRSSIGSRHGSAATVLAAVCVLLSVALLQASTLAQSSPSHSPSDIATPQRNVNGQVSGVPPGARIDSLPGWNPTELNLTQYSGYVSLPDGKQYFYWLVEYSGTEMDAISAPLVMWLSMCLVLYVCVCVYGMFKYSILLRFTLRTYSSLLSYLSRSSLFSLSNSLCLSVSLQISLSLICSFVHTVSLTLLLSLSPLSPSPLCLTLTLSNLTPLSLYHLYTLTNRRRRSRLFLSAGPSGGERTIAAAERRITESESVFVHQSSEHALPGNTGRCGILSLAWLQQLRLTARVQRYHNRARQLPGARALDPAVSTLRRPSVLSLR